MEVKNVLFSLFVLLLLSCSDVDTLVNEIASSSIMEGEHVGLGGAKSDQYMKFNKLKSIASDSEVKNLLQHESPIIRSYAYEILIERKVIDPVRAFEEAMKNDEYFSIMSLDQILQTDITTRIYFYLRNNILNNKTENTQDELISSNSLMNTLDSLILYKMDDYHLLHFVTLKDKMYNQSYNDRIIELALEYNNPSAIFYLDRNKIKADTLMLKSSINHVLKHKDIGTNPEYELRELLKRLN